jgi:hypothetical protein
MNNLKYQTWLQEKLGTLTRLKQRRKRLSRHEKQYVQGIQKRIASLFNDPAISSEDMEKYKEIVSAHGFLVEQAVGKKPIYYGEVVPQIRFLDEGIIGVIWTGKFRLNARTTKASA